MDYDTQTQSGRNVKLIRQLIAYLFTGGVAFLADAGTLYLFTSWFHVFYLYSAILGFCIGLLTNYFLSLALVFNAASSLKDFTVVLLIGIIGLGLTEAGLYLGHGMLHIPVMITKVFVTGVVFLWNFAARKLIVYRD